MYHEIMQVSNWVLFRCAWMG